MHDAVKAGVERRTIESERMGAAVDDDEALRQFGERCKKKVVSYLAGSLDLDSLQDGGEPVGFGR